MYRRSLFRFLLSASAIAAFVSFGAAATATLPSTWTVRGNVSMTTYAASGQSMTNFGGRFLHQRQEDRWRIVFDYAGTETEEEVVYDGATTYTLMRDGVPTAPPSGVVVAPVPSRPGTGGHDYATELVGGLGHGDCPGDGTHFVRAVWLALYSAGVSLASSGGGPMAGVAPWSVSTMVKHQLFGLRAIAEPGRIFPSAIDVVATRDSFAARIAGMTLEAPALARGLFPYAPGQTVGRLEVLEWASYGGVEFPKRSTIEQLRLPQDGARLRTSYSIEVRQVDLTPITISPPILDGPASVRDCRRTSPLGLPVAVSYRLTNGGWPAVDSPMVQGPLPAQAQEQEQLLREWGVLPAAKASPVEIQAAATAPQIELRNLPLDKFLELYASNARKDVWQAEGLPLVQITFAPTKPLTQEQLTAAFDELLAQAGIQMLTVSPQVLLARPILQGGRP